MGQWFRPLTAVTGEVIRILGHLLRVKVKYRKVGGDLAAGVPPPYGGDAMKRSHRGDHRIKQEGITVKIEKSAETLQSDLKFTIFIYHLFIWGVFLELIYKVF